MDPLVILFGLGVGILIGLTGIGGGSLMTPLMILVVGINPLVAIGTDVVYGAITKTLGGWRHFRMGTVDLRLAAWMALGSAPGSVIGVLIIKRLHDQYGERLDSILLGALAVALVLVAFSIIVRALFMPKLIERERHDAKLDGILLGALAVALVLVAFSIIVRALFMPKLIERERHDAKLDARGKVTSVLVGLVFGFIVGLTSVGSGALIGLALILIFHLTPKRVVGTDVFHAAALLWVAGLAHIVSGNVDFGLTANILIGSLPGVWIGTALITKVPQDGLRPALGIVLLAAALAVFTKAGVAMPVAVIVGLPLTIGALAWALHQRRLRGRPTVEVV